MSPLRPHPKSLPQYWERDFERFFSPSPNIGEACPELVEGGVGDEGNTRICKRDMLPMDDYKWPYIAIRLLTHSRLTLPPFHHDWSLSHSLTPSDYRNK